MEMSLYVPDDRTASTVMKSSPNEIHAANAPKPKYLDRTVVRAVKCGKGSLTVDGMTNASLL